MKMNVIKALVIGAIAVAGVTLAAMPAKAASFGSIVDKYGQIWIRMSGIIKLNDYARLKQRINNTPIVSFILDSPGGNVFEAQIFAQAMRSSRAFHAYVADYCECSSACFLIWAASKYRAASPTAHIGVHSISRFDGEETLFTMALTTNQARQLIMDHVSPAVIGRLVSTPPGTAAWLTAKDFEGMGVEIATSKGTFIPSCAE
jgi:hypothetical protein